MKLKEKQKRQRKNYINKQQKLFKLFDRSWIEIGALHSNWNKYTSSFINILEMLWILWIHKITPSRNTF